MGGRGRVHEANHLVRCLTHKTSENALRFLRRLRTRCLDDPVIPTDRGSWYREAVIRAGFHNHIHQTFGLRSSVERFFGNLKDRTRVFYNNVNPKKTLFGPLVGFLELLVRWYTE